MQDIRCVELIRDERQGGHRRDPVRWVVQAILLTLVSPALIAVLFVGGVFISVQKLAAITDRVFSVDRPGLKVAGSHHTPVQKPVTSV